MLIKGVDISNWTGLVEREQFQALQNEGFRFVIAGTQNPAATRRQLEAAKAAGMAVEIYVYLYYDGSDDRRISTALNIAQDFGINLIWLDVESSPQFPPGNEDVVATLNQAAGRIIDAGLTAGIYTSGNYWPSMTNNSKDFSELPLWNAAYLLNREPTENDFENWVTEWPEYGDWKHPHTWQYTGSTNIHGVTVDQNMRWLPGAQPEPEPQPDPVELWIAGAYPRGILLKGNQMQVYNGPEHPVLIIGSEDGGSPGQLAKLYPEGYRWLVSLDMLDEDENPMMLAKWQSEAGD